MSSGQIPDRPPRKRERSRWPELLLIGGITLTVAGFVLTVGPLAPELGGTDLPPFDEPADDPPNADVGDESDDTGNNNVNGDEATETEEIDDTETNGIRAMIGHTASGDDDSARADDDETREECVVE